MARWFCRAHMLLAKKEYGDDAHKQFLENGKRSGIFCLHIRQIMPIIIYRPVGTIN